MVAAHPGHPREELALARWAPLPLRRDSMATVSTLKESGVSWAMVSQELFLVSPAFNQHPTALESVEAKA